MCQALKRARSQYTPPNSSTISGKLLDDLNDGAAEARAEAVRLIQMHKKWGARSRATLLLQLDIR